MENNIKSIHIELNGDSDTYSVEIVSTEGTVVIPYMRFAEFINSDTFVSFVLQRQTHLEEDTQNV